MDNTNANGYMGATRPDGTPYLFADRPALVSINQPTNFSKHDTPLKSVENNQDHAESDALVIRFGYTD